MTVTVVMVIQNTVKVKIDTGNHVSNILSKMLILYTYICNKVCIKFGINSLPFQQSLYLLNGPFYMSHYVVKGDY